jgi:hypothetical protein
VFPLTSQLFFGEISMSRFHSGRFAVLFLLAACNSARVQDDANFTKAINEFLTKHGEACTVIGRDFPIDLYRSEQKNSMGLGQSLRHLKRPD